MEFTQAATTRLPPNNRSKWSSSGRQLPVIQRQNGDLAHAISSAPGKQQPMTMQIRVYRYKKSTLDRKTETPEVKIYPK